MLRVTAPGGLIYLDFGPLYCSPWGLHAYRSLRMPYPQFLFSPTFTSAKLKKLGVFDLGKSRNELQNLNRWKFQEFAAVWNCAKTEIIASHLISDEKQLNIIVEYPECFRGRGLSFQDVTCSNVNNRSQKADITSCIMQLRAFASSGNKAGEAAPRISWKASPAVRSPGVQDLFHRANYVVQNL